MIKVAIIGAGIGREHLAAYQQTPEFNVEMIVDEDQTRLEELCGTVITRACDLEDALASDADVIDVCLPPALHVEATLRSLSAGKHVICEKPIAASLEEIDQLQATASKSGRKVFPVFQYRFAPAFQKLRALRDRGFLGKAKLAALETHWNRGQDYYAVPWRGTWDYEQGGAIISHAIHAHDLLEHIFTPVQAVSAKLGTLINPIETEDTATVMFDLEGGGFATSSITLGAATDETRIRLIYEQLTATSSTVPYAPGTGDWFFLARDPEHQTAVDKVISTCQPENSGFVGLFEEIAKSINGDPNRAPTLDEGRRSIELATAIYASDRINGIVELPLGSEHPLYAGWREVHE